MPLTTIASFREPHIAHIARAKLESEGIPVFLSDEHAIGVSPLYADVLGGVKLQVPEELADRAREIVSEDRSREVHRLVRDQRGSRAGDRCPGCGSKAFSQTIVARDTKVRRCGLPFVLWINDRSCDGCGARW